jgi:hypothetical protein
MQAADVAHAIFDGDDRLRTTAALITRFAQGVPKT